jgi:hypothetical protein
VGARALLEELTNGCKGAAAVLRQRTSEAAGSVVRALLTHRAPNVSEIPPSVLDDQFEGRESVVD